MCKSASYLRCYTTAQFRSALGNLQVDHLFQYNNIGRTFSPKCWECGDNNISPEILLANLHIRLMPAKVGAESACKWPTGNCQGTVAELQVENVTPE